MTDLYMMFAVFFLISTVGGIVLNDQESKCQFNARCRCEPIGHGNMFKADCSRRKFKSIPKFPNNVVEINLSHNEIKYIQNDKFRGNGKLLSLDLSHNFLQNLTAASFQGLDNLITLLINNNNISHVDEITFDWMKNLQVLNFKMNLFNSLGINFTIIPSLVSAKLDFVPTGGELQTRICGFPELSNLDVSGSSGKCKVKTLTNETFELLPKLESVDVSGCNINYIYRGTFQHLTSLMYLDVSSNKCLEMEGFENITYDLPNTSIKVLKINKIRQTFALNVKLTVPNIQHLLYTNLTELHAEGNRIQLVEKGALLKVPSTLKYAFLSDNSFSYGSYIYELHHLSVHFVNMSFLSMTHDLLGVTEKCDINHPTRYSSQSKLSRSFLGYSVGFDNSERNLEFIFFRLPPNLTTMIYSHCNLRYKIPSLHLPNNKLEHIDLSNNVFYSLIGPIHNVDHLQYLDLSNNFCQNMSKELFMYAKNLKTLRMKKNFLGFVLPNDMYGETFQNLTALEFIDLSFNRIPHLPRKFFKNQKLLHELFIGDNMLDDVTFEIHHMHHLFYLDISNNRITSLHEESRNQLDAIFTINQNLTLDLSGNRLQCTCQTMDFVKWISTTNIHLNNFRKTDCHLINKTVVNLRNAELIYSMLEKECSSYTNLIVTMVSLIVLFGTILTWGLMYRHRWKLRYLYYMIKSRRKRGTNAKSNANENIYENDAFISYADQDSTFVRTNLIGVLEREAGFKLCVHERDFLAGKAIASNITYAVHNSRLTIVVMSSSYLESYWCMFEYNMARMESIHARNKSNILFLVVLEQMQPKQLPLDILALMESQSYIEFPNDQYGDTVFWDKLKQVLST